MASPFVALAIFTLIDGAIFHSGLYASFVEPNSAAGALHSFLWMERHRKLDNRPQILAIGDSRMGFRSRVLNDRADVDFTFASIATQGTTPRVWYYMLREIDPHADRYVAIVFGVDSFDDEDWEDHAKRQTDIYYLSPILRIQDAITFGSSFPSFDLRWEAIQATLMRGWTFRRDVQALLRPGALEQRLKDVEWVRQEYAKAIYSYVYPEESLTGVTIDWKTRTATFPEGLSEQKRQQIKDVLLRPWGEYTGKQTAYMREWIGRIASRYRGSNTKLIFLRLPRGPIVRPGWTPQGSALRELARRGEIILADEHFLDEVEKPEMFIDAAHMNGPGSERFTYLVGAQVERILGGQAAH
jgi:hypothetical protein